MRSLGRFNLIGCQVAHVDHTVILTCGVYTISVDFGLSLQYLVAPVGHTAIVTYGVLPPQRGFSSIDLRTLIAHSLSLLVVQQTGSPVSVYLTKNLREWFYWVHSLETFVSSVKNY
ncbi:hypothetical protein MTR_3g053630 [Medicago truncatula]|uniref:Uncharacterized protein n=1 Tax=Medicago truncatula TaxID=3880 RepID=A0A072UXV1_MEDTR|nr:hypothetical protein MTR_3g053630 [Medicago truncatula]